MDLYGFKASLAYKASPRPTKSYKARPCFKRTKHHQKEKPKKKQDGWKPLEMSGSVPSSYSSWQGSDKATGSNTPATFPTGTLAWLTLGVQGHSLPQPPSGKLVGFLFPGSQPSSPNHNGVTVNYDITKSRGGKRCVEASEGWVLELQSPCST